MRTQSRTKRRRKTCWRAKRQTRGCPKIMTSVLTAHPFGVPDLPSACFSEFEDPGTLGVDTAATRLGKHAPGWLVQRLFRQIKRAPVDAKQCARIEIHEGLYRFLRSEMH